VGSHIRIHAATMSVSGKRELDIQIIDAQLSRIFDSFKNNQDVFVQLVCNYADGSQVVVGRTEVCKNGNLHPRWSERFLCARESGRGGKTLMFQLHIHHTWRNPVLCGEAEFGLDNLWSRAGSGPQRVPVPLFKKGEQTGILNIQIALQGAGGTPNEAAGSMASAGFAQPQGAGAPQRTMGTQPQPMPGRDSRAGYPMQAPQPQQAQHFPSEPLAPPFGASIDPSRGAPGALGLPSYSATGVSVPYYPAGPVQQALSAMNYPVQQQGAGLPPPPLARGGGMAAGPVPGGPGGGGYGGYGGYEAYADARSSQALPQATPQLQPGGPPPAPQGGARSGAGGQGQSRPMGQALVMQPTGPGMSYAGPGGPHFPPPLAQPGAGPPTGAGPPAAPMLQLPAGAIVQTSPAGGKGAATGMSGQWWNSFIDRG